ncbi:MAG TPA: hypothetical protein VNJ07_10575 [Chitinophagales bacterium]|nr:hypothetical protein [Chitinophagales bacterium]
MTKKNKESGSKKTGTKKKEIKSLRKKETEKKASSVKKEHQRAKGNKKVSKVEAKAQHAKSKTVQAEAPKKTATQTMAADTSKKRLMISYEKLPPEVMEVIRTKYPYGYNHDLKEVKGIDNKKFFVLPIELPDVIYLVKVDLRKPIQIRDEGEEEDIFTPEEEFAGEEEGFPAEDLEQIESEEEEGGEEEVKKKRRDEEDEEV